MFDELDQPLMTDRVEELRDVGVENPVDVACLDPEREGVQRVMLATPRPAGNSDRCQVLG